MKEFFRGDTFLKTINFNNYTLEQGDKIHYAIMKNTYSNEYIYENTIEIDKELNSIDILIEPIETSKFPIGFLVLEIELTYGGDHVKTKQYKFEVSEDGIH